MFLPNQGPTSQRSRKNGSRNSCLVDSFCNGFFWGTPKKIGGEKNTKKHDMKKTPFFLFTKNWNRDDVLFSICIAWKKSNLCFVLVCDWLCLDPFFWSGEVVRRPTKFAFYFSLWQLAAVVTWLTSCNSKWTIQKLYFMFGVKLKHFCSSSLGEV